VQGRPPQPTASLPLIAPLSMENAAKGEGGDCKAGRAIAPPLAGKSPIGAVRFVPISGGSGAGQAPEYNVLRSNTLPCHRTALYIGARRANAKILRVYPNLA